MKNSNDSRCYSRTITASCSTMLVQEEYVKQQLLALEGADADTIAAQYRNLVSADADTENLGRKFMQHRVAHAIQVAALGGLNETELNLLSFLATKDWRCNPKIKPPSEKDKKPRVGTTFVRQYKGKEYKLEIDSLGRYVYEGTAYKSPTTVARLITGSHVNGKVWWGISGVNTKGAPK